MNDFQTLKMGTMLHNTYMVERVLGQGGFGITYLAIHVRLKKKVAIKEFFPKSFCDRDADTSHVRTASKANSVTVEKLKNKFIKEAEHIAEMDSPYIVRIIDVFEENHTAYYIMDYIEGRSLSDIVKKDGPLPVTQALEYISKIGEALTYIHSKRMNHLDVKPANIMVRSKDNVPILIDFGLSKQYDSDGNQTSTTPVGLSHGYAPIEQYREGGVKEFSPQTDLYSLAATLYYILSGTVPPQATTLVEDDLIFPTSFPSYLEWPIREAMSSSRKRRQDNIDAFIVEINSVIENKNSSTSSNDSGTMPESDETSISSDFMSEKELEDKNTDLISGENASDNDFSEYNFDNECEIKVPFYRKTGFIIVVSFCAVLLLIGLYQLGYLSIFNPSWQPTYGNQFDESSIISEVDDVESNEVLDSIDSDNLTLIPTSIEPISATNHTNDKKTRTSETNVANPISSSQLIDNETTLNDNEIFVVIDEQAEFPGGLPALMKWLSQQIRYPEAAQQNDIQGRVVVRFVVEKDGSIGQVTIVKGINKDLDSEAIRIVKNMPKWHPGKNNGIPVRSYFNLPVTFRLDSK